jgi:hypothetical protein
MSTQDDIVDLGDAKVIPPRFNGVYATWTHDPAETLNGKRARAPKPGEAEYMGRYTTSTFKDCTT